MKINVKNYKIIFLIAYACYSLVYICRLNLSIAATSLPSISTKQYGFISTAFLIAFSCGRLINGVLGDKVHPRYMLFCGLMLSGIANLFLGFLPPFYIFITLWFINGYGQSMLWSSILAYVSYVTPIDKRVKTISYLISSVAVGSVLGLLIATFFTTKISVNAAFFVPGILSIIISFFPLLTFNQKLEYVKNTKQKNGSFFGVLKYPCVLIILIPTILHGIIKDNISTWAPKYFQATFGLQLSQMQIFVYAIPLVGMVGRLLYPTLFSALKHKTDYVTLLAAGISCISLIPFVVGVDNVIISAICLSVVSMAINIINTSFISMFPLNFEKTGNVSSVAGFLDFVAYLGAAFASTLYGNLIKGNDYSVIFYSWIIISVVISAFILLIIKFPNLQKERVEK